MFFIYGWIINNTKNLVLKTATSIYCDSQLLWVRNSDWVYLVANALSNQAPDRKLKTEGL